MTIHEEQAQSIVDEMKCSIHHDINIMDRQGTIIASTNPLRKGQLHQGAAELIRRELPSLTVERNDPARGVQVGINLPIVIGGELVGVIGITGEPEEVSVFGDIIKRMTELMLLRQQQREDSQLMERARGLFLENWLFSEDPDWPELELRGRLLGLDINRPYTVAVLQLIAHSAEEMESSRILQMIQSRLSPGHYCAAIRNQIVLLLHGSGRAESRQLVGRICREVGSYYGAQVGGGVSRQAKDPRDIRRCYLEARTAGTVAVQSGKSQVVVYDKTSLEFIVQSIPKPILTDLREMLFSACTPEETEEALPVIRLYFECGGDLKLCAERSFVHRNTIQYRIDRLKRKTGYDLRRPKDGVLLYLAAQGRERG